MNKILKSVVAAGTGLLMVAGVATAANGYSLFGTAEYVSPGNGSARAVELESNNPGEFGGIDYTVPSGTTFADLQTLSSDYMFTEGTCGLGSPRFQVNVADPNSADTGNIFVYFGTPPNYNDCPTGVWTNTGNLLGVLPIDTTQLDAGAFYDPYATALAKYGDYVVTGIQLVADSGTQVVQIDNTNVDGTLYGYEANVPTNKEQCKKGGYANLEDANGQPFKNQGQCVSYFNHQ